MPGFELLLFDPADRGEPTPLSRSNEAVPRPLPPLVVVIGAANLFSLGLLINALLSGKAENGKE